MRSIQLVLSATVGAGLAVASASPAAARQCASGQIFQVSKSRCISKAAAAKAGIKVYRKGVATNAAPNKGGAAKDEGEADDASPAERKASRADKAAEKSEAERDAKADEATEQPVRIVAVRNDPAKAREAWNAAVAAAGKGGEQSASPVLGFAPQEGDVRRNVAPFGALQFGGLR